jgi:hypothetical protein
MMAACGRSRAAEKAALADRLAGQDEAAIEKRQIPSKNPPQAATATTALIPDLKSKSIFITGAR